MSEYEQRPILKALDGGRGLSADQADREWRAAWEEIATACDRGLMTLHPMHPRRPDLLSLARDARCAARLPAEPRLRIG